MLQWEQEFPGTLETCSFGTEEPFSSSVRSITYESIFDGLVQGYRQKTFP